MDSGQTATTKRRRATEIVAEVFTRLAALFPRTFDSAYRDANMLNLARREMAQEIAAWPVLPEKRQLDSAMSDIKRSGATWPPTVPDMIARLRPSYESAGMPSVEDAWREAVEHSHAPTLHRWSHEAARLAGEMAGWSNIQENRRMERGKTPAQMFAEHYDALANRVIAGEPLVARHLIESDACRSPAELAERAGRERAAQEAERYSSLTTHTDALTAMRTLLKGE